MGILIPVARCRELKSHSRSWSVSLKALAGIPVLAFGCLSALGNDSTDEFDNWGMHTLGVQSCAGVLDGSEDGFATAADCVENQLLSKLLDVTFQEMENHGDALFGEHFHLDHRLSFSASGGGISGNLDAVIPLNSFTSLSGEQVTRAVFLQNGFTRWRDAQGFQRNDMRFGLVHRMAMSDVHPDVGVLGTSVFFQENLERGHARIVTGLDYTDRWGTGSLSYFMPVTDWRAGRFGHEERALEGVEFELRTDVTTTIRLNAAAGHWERKDGSEGWTTRGRLGIGWQLHPWFGLQGSWKDIGTADDSLGLHAVVAIPFGGSEAQRPRWRGLGRAGLDSGEFDPGAIWNSVNNVGQIEVAERKASQEDEADEPVYPQFPSMFDQLGSGQ